MMDELTTKLWHAFVTYYYGPFVESLFFILLQPYVFMLLVNHSIEKSFC